MIAALRGLVDQSGEDWVILDVQGVGYLVGCSAKTLAKLPAAGQAVRLRIDTHVREDQIALYGFLDEAERDWFRLLQTVQGVGARVALALLSVLSPAELAGAIVAGDKAMLSRANGVGPRLAARLLTELKDKAASVALSASVGLESAVGAGGGSGVGAAPLVSGPLEDAISALVNLGYRRFDAHAAVTQVAASLGEDVAVNKLIGAALKRLGQELGR